MKQLLILSGKGGTGKTTIASSFIKLSKARSYADCDVDAPNLHLVIKRRSKPIQTDFFGLPNAKINLEKCIECGICKDVCRFDAITLDEGYKVDAFACEGCGVCKIKCPENAISMVKAKSGDLILYKNFKTFSTGKLKMGSGNSGKLVTEVKRQLDLNNESSDIAIIDGSPGIGCPVIASISGVDMILIVTEPSVSGISDMQRIIETSKIFQPKIAVCINKYDVNMENTEKIKDYCETNCLPFLGGIPYDKRAVELINKGKTIVDENCPSGIEAEKIFYKTLKLLYQEES